MRQKTLDNIKLHGQHNAAMYDLRPIKNAMAEQGIGIRGLSEKSGMKPTGVRDLLSRGSGRPENIKRLADALGVPMKKLIRRKRAA